MKKNNFSVLFILMCLLFSACANEDIKKWPEKGNFYDPSKPVSFDSMIPDWGRINDAFIIKGNFPTDTSQIKVFFGDKKAVLVSSDGREAFGLVPKQMAGYNKVSVIVDGKSYNSDNAKFKYYQTQSVKTTVGKFDERKFVTGLLGEARLEYCSNIVAVKGKKTDNILFQAGGWNDKTYFVSLEDNVMTQLINIGYLGGLTVDNTGEKVAIMSRNGGAIYTAKREDGWTINSLGVNVPFSGDCQGSLAFGNDNSHVFVMDGDGLWSVDLENKNYEEVLKVSDFPSVYNGINTGQWFHYLCYSRYDDCFYVSYNDQNGIVKMWKDKTGKWQAERYAGFQPGNKTALGDRLLDAVLRRPMGMAVNSDGELFVCCHDSQCILKIKGRLVSLVAGHLDASGNVNGNPTDAYLNGPECITIDSDENFYIGEENSGTIRKITIE
ncbi:IPT/TIG domain-containing protein [Xylanibacter oryzae]|uniref:IPT/TIG domain-containing protein n=1 Tax=Xylanibacter oryzae TaxID=185293 RepID=UPI00055BF96E|nr:IPT/TIG domain-containing protein [Xylanibacter oryzae]